MTAQDCTDDFDCGIGALSLYLHRCALINQKAGSTQTYVCRTADRIAGFYSLAVDSIVHREAPQRVTKGLAHHPLPVMILARLAVAVRDQHQGLGAALLKNALLRTVQAADIAGIRAVLVHTKDKRVKDWYASFNFEPGITDPHHMFLLLKDIRAVLL